MQVTYKDRLMAAAVWKSLDVSRGFYGCAGGAGGRLLQLTLIGARLKYQGHGLSHAVSCRSRRCRAQASSREVKNPKFGVQNSF
jgi:hypothetical protein